MALANPTVTNGVTPGHCIAVRFATGGAHAGHAYSHLGVLRKDNDQADVYYCQQDNTVFIENG